MKRILSSTLLIFIFLNVTCQEKKNELSIEDAVLAYYKGLYPSSLKGLSWTSNNQYVFENTNEYIILDPEKASDSKKRKAITLKKLAELCKDSVPLSNLPWKKSIAGNIISFSYLNTYYTLDLKKKTKTSIVYPQNASTIDVSGNKQIIAYTLDNNLFIAKEKDSMVSITSFKDKNIVSGQAIHRFEFGISKGTFWSPSNNSLAFYQKDETEVADYPLLNINTTPGSLTTTKYPMAGQKSEKARIGIYHLKSKKTIYLNTGKIDDHYLTNLTWGPESKYIYVAEVNRNQNHMQLIKYDANSGEQINVLFEEKNDKWVEPEHGLYFLPQNSNEFIWMSERDGFMNLYHYNIDGKLIGQLTKNNWVTTSIIGINEETNEVYYTGTGNDPRNLHAFSVDIQNNKNQKQITVDEGVHHVQLSPNKKYLIDEFSSLNNPGSIVIHDLLNDKTTKIYESDNPLINHDIGSTEMITLKADDDTELFGRIIKPSSFDASKKYPVMVYVYGGPHAQLVTNDWLGGASLWMHWMAEQGYVIFTLDGRGSAHRGFDFESSVHRNLGTLEIKDQLKGISYLKSLDFIDTNRFAIHGWSYGGFMTTSLMLREPGTFSTGVAGGPVIDWKWYEVMYGERYMDTPEQNPEGYKTASLLEYVNNLEGKLLMIHGTADDVVVMQHNLAFVQKCVSEGVQIDFFPYPMHLHNVRGKDRVHLMTKILNYILENN